MVLPCLRRAARVPALTRGAHSAHSHPPCSAPGPEACGSRPEPCAPPCPRPPPPCPLTCHHATRKKRESPSSACVGQIQSLYSQPSGCGCDQDPVARRLQLAQSVRRAHYEREVAARRAAAPPPACFAPYALARQRKFATDGCTKKICGD